MRLNEIPNYDGSIWAYAQMAKYAREMHGPENFTKALYEGGQASMVLPMIGLSVVTAIIGAGAALLINAAAKKENPNATEKKSAVSAKSQSKRLI
ncbi:unknown [Clostridium sp. CAG:138]|nr:hypothetical protein [Clostridium sp.]CDA51430.1 unknown [Clostridium sp. CAG:138]